MAQCVTCGSELHPERAEKYGYCTKRECREQNAKPRTVVSVGMNKAADQYLVLNERTKGGLAAGKYQDQRKSGSVAGQRPGRDPIPAARAAARPARRADVPNRPRIPGASLSRTLPSTTRGACRLRRSRGSSA
jgi:hypothetical protein